VIWLEKVHKFETRDVIWLEKVHKAKTRDVIWLEKIRGGGEAHNMAASDQG
jgi:hypothetical protein